MTRPVDKAYSAIKQDIISCRYFPTQSLVESNLAAEIGVSRNTVKKALLMLVKENLVTIEQNKSAKVKAFTRKEVIDLYEVRIVLECFIVDRVVSVITDEWLNEAKKLLDEMKKVSNPESFKEYSLLNDEFHKYIYSACPNHSAVEIAKNLHSQIRRYSSRTVLYPGRNKQSYEEHLALWKAMKKRDSVAAQEAMSIHLHNVITILKENYTLLL